MRPVVVVVVAPVVNDAAHVAQTGEPVLRQALVTEAAVEALDVGVLHRLAGLDEAQLDAVAGSPASASRRKPMICSSVYRFFIGPISISG